MQLSDALIEELEAMSVTTPDGTFVNIADLKKRRDADKASAVVHEGPVPKTITQAREGAKQFLKDAGIILGTPQIPSRAIPANAPSGVETV